MTYSAGAGAAAAAAARRRRLLLREEEEMTSYTQNDVNDDWEFKIVRANTGVFSKPAELNKLIDEEARAGWVMLEKFDNSRIRFKRKRSARLNDANLPVGIDPYRVHYGMSPTGYTILVLALVFGVIFGMLILIAGLTNGFR